MINKNESENEQALQTKYHFMGYPCANKEQMGSLSGLTQEQRLNFQTSSSKMKPQQRQATNKQSLMHKR